MRRPSLASDLLQIPSKVALPAAVFLSCCTSAPTPVEAPSLQFDVSHFVGGALSGVSAASVAQAPAAAEDAPAPAARADLRLDEILAVEASVSLVVDSALDAPATTDGDHRTSGPSRSAVLLLAPDTADPIRGRAPELRDVQIAFGRDAAVMQRLAIAAVVDPLRGVAVAAESALIYRDVVARFSLSSTDEDSRYLILSRTDDGAVRVVLGGRRDQDGQEVVAVLSERLEPDAADGEAATLWLQWPRPSDDPSRTTSAGNKAQSFCVSVRVSPASNLDRVAVGRAVRRAEEQVREAAEISLRATVGFDDDQASVQRVGVTFRAIQDPSLCRAALSSLLEAGTTRVHRIARDYAVTTTDDVLEQWSAELRDEAAPDFADELGMVWRVSRAGLRILGRRVDRDVAEPAETGLLLRGFGEAGRFPSDLVRALGSAADAQQLWSWVVAENRRLLGSSDPAARIRALDWLADAGDAPSAFDPFASRDERRDALRADEAAREAAASAAESMTTSEQTK